MVVGWNGSWDICGWFWLKILFDFQFVIFKNGDFLVKIRFDRYARQILSFLYLRYLKIEIFR